ncbi:LOW QUALITY PROTEIN: general transcription factor II-I repeat domain-containing protein 2-like [Cotesia typhae]|uniref:LOW QUALITY PROTEIN: general transcription factor II-I repeat domain-containing protein 2-like n=1 Tax=Cotesia typhae TaxID=2053667 RepID=UPI003D68787B
MAKRFMQPKLAEKFESVALSHQTVARRIEDMGNYITKSLCDYFVDCEYYSICLDESTDQTDVSQLIIFIRCISKDFTITEEMLDLIPFHGTTKGSDIFEAVNKTIVEYGGFRKCSCIVTDGAKAMTGKVTGFAGLLIQNGIDCPLFHCIIHQEALCGKSLRQMNAMKVVIRITNLIRGGNRSLTHRKFRDFLCEIDANYGDLLLHSEIRWLSAGQCCNAFLPYEKKYLYF